MRKIVFPVSGITALAMTHTAWADVSDPATGPHAGWHGPMGGPWSGHWGGWMMGGPVAMILTVALIAVLVIVLMRWSDRHRRADRPKESRAIEILKERFARGEIDQAEFEERRSVLGA